MIKQRSSDADFQLWISSDDLSTDFAYLKAFLESKSTDYSKFMQLFLTPGKRYAEAKEIAKLSQKSANPFAKPLLTTNIHKSLAKLNGYPNEITSKQFAEIFKTCFFLPDFVSISLFALISKNTYKKKTKTIKFQDAINFMSDNFSNSTIDDLFFYILSENFSSKYCKTQCLLKIIYRYVTTSDKFASLDLENQGYRTKEAKINLLTDFAIYICSKIEIVFDPELHNRLERRNITLDLFLKALDNCAIFEHFIVIYTKFKELQAQPADFITFKEILNYDCQRIDSDIMKRCLRILSSTTDNIYFFTFVKFVTFLEDKASIGALNFWFRVCDSDEDGFISISEMEALYDAQIKKLKQIGYTADSFDIILPQLMDAVSVHSTKISRKDLRNCGRWVNFFNLLVDPKTYNEADFKDPLFSFKLNSSTVQTSLWDEYVQREISNYNN
ncbi:EF hand family protein [Trichomonas vaginalis G3]|uniref:EF hand family protein n=1 Tax=Trichomonas vaginalis (strain ATCC PRA-98 / G3) TaxID=412133 RepID=A2DPT6_TRIV3|nr:positive regulation of B cell differentiation protein family [Trichomonas vaginalis G3]EAY17532.1 EF hand family protein [Trichomonas vaginalis G3]KAI5520576.1 positive regulation of B cell differentiation protein family [Trichomonas vaginalis G3]|eukprot:XP_001329667.1 EF hand family protein [Trichomonas vaginalis G3]